MSNTADPYLSIVVSARNDDHGGNPLGRMQIFLSGWIEQARRYNIPSEIIIVEWNPLPDRPLLIDVLQWPDDLGPCAVRFIEVPPELHALYPHGDALPLYQMIAKNVGIRRARGEFVLATNIDILFSDELAQYLSERRLRTSRMYRIDRHDAMSDVPPDASLSEQLTYCATHLLRVNAREGTFKVTPQGLPQLDTKDVTASGSGIVFGRGWYAPESYLRKEYFRWAANFAELHLDAPSQPGRTLMLEVEPGPSTGGLPVSVTIEADGETAARVTIERRQRLRLRFARGYPAQLRFHAEGGTVRANRDPRQLTFRVFQIEWEQARSAAPPRMQAELSSVPGSRRLAILGRALRHLVELLAQGGPLVPVTVPVPPPLRRLLKLYVDWDGFKGMARDPGAVFNGLFHSTPVGADIVSAGSGLTLGAGWLLPEWFRGRGFRRTSGAAEILLAPSAGSKLTLQTEAEGATSGQAFTLRLIDTGGQVVAEAPLQAAHPIEFPLPAAPGRTRVLRLQCQDAQGAPAALLVFRCERSQAASTTEPAALQPPWGAGWTLDRATGIRSSLAAAELLVLVQGGALFLDLETAAATRFELRAAGALLAEFSVDGRSVQRVSLNLEAGRTHVLDLNASGPFRAHYCGSAEPNHMAARVVAEPNQTAPDFLHTNACGDFTLLSKQQWCNLRGYAEMDLYSMNLDSLFCFAAHYAGAREEVLAEPMRIYHIEHGVGSGWTPEGQAKLFQRIAARGLSFIGNDEIMQMATEMRRFGSPMIFNHEDWGLASFELKETQVPQRRHDR